MLQKRTKSPPLEPISEHKPRKYPQKLHNQLSQPQKDTPKNTGTAPVHRHSKPFHPFVIF